MKRAWVVRPDEETGVVSDEAMVDSLLEAAVMLKRGGGVLSVITQREPTGFPGEMVTTAAVFEWKDRTDAKPQPEQREQIVEPEPTDELEALDPDGIDDGLDPASLPDEDFDGATVGR